MPLLIYGKGKVGQSLSRFCEHNDIKYVIADDADFSGDYSLYSSIIPSPGISSSHSVYATDKIVTELDFLFRFIPKGFQIHAVTGTDGKSTTCHILYHFLCAGFSDLPVYLGGNFGTPLGDIVSEIQEKGEKEGHIVLEVSSFMAYHIRTFYATNSILTNLHPDHLDWHKDLSEYLNAKQNLLAHTKNLLLYPESVIEMLPELPHFPVESIVLRVLEYEQHLLTLSPGIIIDLSDCQLLGIHNVRNIFFAANLALRFGVSAKILSSTLPLISPLPHRIQQVSDVGGKIWIEDSKSTTAQSLYAALEAFEGKKVYLIAGGKDKGDTFDRLPEYLKKYCENCVFIGETKPQFLQAAHEAFVPAISVPTLEEAVAHMWQITQEGDIILLSPGCASLDMFTNYEERARRYVEAIHVLK